MLNLLTGMVCVVYVGLEQVRARLEKMIEEKTGRTDLAGKTDWPALNELVDQRERLMVTLAGKEARESAIQREIETANLTTAGCHLSLSELGKGLKQGKIEIPWKSVRAWLKPAPAKSAAASSTRNMPPSSTPSRAASAISRSIP